MINVTKTFLPKLSEVTALLEGVWERVHLTNNGILVVDLEKKLKEYLGVKHLFFVNNGTIAIQIAIQAAGLAPGDEIITTPFSYVATTSSIVWENCKPVFVDIDPETLCLDPTLIEKAITPKTKGILATHVYGNPCDVEAIKAIADKHNLKVIYDAAHAFGTEYKGTSLLNYGDVSTLSFHATKLFHSAEGGAIICNDDALAHRISYMRNFGHNGPEAFFGVGVNGKSSELHAAVGLCVLPHVPSIIERRKAISNLYDTLLADVPIKRPRVLEGTSYNYAYYPVLFSSEAALLHTRELLNAAQIFPRRYFYPSLNTLSYVAGQTMPVSEDICTRVLCLPLYFDLLDTEVALVCDTIKQSFC